MPRRTKAALTERALTYHPVGLTITGWDRSDPPAGFRADERTICLGTGPSRWAYIRGEVLEWGVKTRSGFTVEVDDTPTGGDHVHAPAVIAQRYWLIARLGPLRIREPVEVVAAIDEPNRTGFAYGTLTGHPVSGEEAFVVDRRVDDSIWLTVRSLTRPAGGLWRAIFPLLRVAQRFYKNRYARALQASGA